jgi:broad specificity phosphatase PhoE
MLRQQQTAAEVKAAYTNAEFSFPEIVVEPGWNEFDFHQIYREIAPQICEVDADFRSEYEVVRSEIEASAGAHDAEIHRRWRPSDTKVVEAWACGRYRHGGETWEQFRERVAACRLKLREAEKRANVAVFTSATPAAIMMGLSLGILDDHVRQLAGVLRNTSYTVLHLRAEGLRLLSFNEVPHLNRPELRTRR